MKKFFLVLFFVLCPVLLRASSSNPPVNDSGVSTYLCDVRNEHDSLNPVSDGSLRDRLERFNNEEQCLSGIYFLESMTLVLEAPLEIKAIETKLKDGKNKAGTYVTGLDQKGEKLPIIIDAREITAYENQCAFMIENGLETFQQIHDITIIVSDKNQTICDDQGENLLTQEVPDTSNRSCAEGALAHECDFKDITIIVDTTLIDQDQDGILDKEDRCPDFADNDGTGENLDTDKDHLADACEDSYLQDGDNDGYPDGRDLCNDLPIFTAKQIDKISPEEILKQPLNFRRSQGNRIIDLKPSSLSSTNLDSEILISAQKSCFFLREDWDRDGDGLGDACDPDIDGDSLKNKKDAYPCSVDGDGDGIEDNLDQCPEAHGNSNDGCPEVLPTEEEPVDPIEEAQEEEIPVPEESQTETNPETEEPGEPEEDPLANRNEEVPLPTIPLGTLGGGCSLASEKSYQGFSYWWVEFSFILLVRLFLRRKNYV